MTAKELDTMVNAMRSEYNKIETRMDVCNPLFYLQRGLKAIGRTELAEQLVSLYVEIDGIDSNEIAEMGIFI